MIVDEHLFKISDIIARKHVKPGWFESNVHVLVRMIRLRTAIYNAMSAAREDAANLNPPE